MIPGRLLPAHRVVAVSRWQAAFRMAFKDPERAKAYQRRWQVEHRASKNASTQRWRDANPETTRAQNNLYNMAHREQRRAYSRTYAAEHLEQVQSKGRVYRETHRVELRAAAKAYAAKHTEQLRISRRVYDKAHPEIIRARRHAFAKAHPENRRAKDGRRRARKNGTIATLTAAQWKAILTAYKGRCAYCGVKPKKITQDHVVPLSRGGAHTAENVVPACISCNLHKGDRQPPTLPAVRLLL